ncbi:MAG: FecR domain-containing protein [Myxococcales bacterium]|nr:FecR domain-containing protein [Myxococcales bacterium]
MKSCESLWQTEALLEGRLSGKALRAAERHLASCTRCRTHVDQAAQIRQGMQQLGGGAPSELDLARGRQRLLAAANQHLRRPGPRASRRKLILAAALFLVAAVLWVRLQAKLPFPHETAEYSVQIEASADAEYARSAPAQRELVNLEQGELKVSVLHGTGERTLLVRTPDLEIEDQGTVFSVRVENRKTLFVRVEEGRVALRGAGPRPVLIEAGDTWSRPTEVSERASTPEPALKERAAPAPVAPAATSASSATAPPAATSVTSNAHPSATPTPASADSDFEVAMQAFRAGSWSRAAQLFSAFEAQHPRSKRAEDAAYLRVVALQRAGQTAQMKSAADAYLSRYPKGFRSKEVRALSASK